MGQSSIPAAVVGLGPTRSIGPKVVISGSASDTLNHASWQTLTQGTKHLKYLIEFNILAAAASPAVSLYVNANETEGDYTANEVSEQNGTILRDLLYANSARIARAEGSNCAIVGWIEIRRDLNGFFTAKSEFNGSDSGAPTLPVNYRMWSIKDAATIGSITELKLKDSFASSFDVGSWAQLFEIIGS